MLTIFKLLTFYIAYSDIILTFIVDTFGTKVTLISDVDTLTSTSLKPRASP